MLLAEFGAQAIIEALGRREGVPDFAGYSKEYQAAFDRDNSRFGNLARHPELRLGLVDLLTGIVGTARAVEVTSTIGAFLEGKLVL